MIRQEYESKLAYLQSQIDELKQTEIEEEYYKSQYFLVNLQPTCKVSCKFTLGTNHLVKAVVRGCK